MARPPQDAYGYRLREILEGKPLSARETEVLRWAARGKTTAGTGRELWLAFETVKTHRQRACAKLGAESITHAVALALVRGLIDPREVEGDRSRA